MKRVVVRRRSKNSSDFGLSSGLKSPAMSPQDVINISRMSKSSSHIAPSCRSPGTGGKQRLLSPSSAGTVIKNEKGQFVLEQVIDTADGGTRVQHTLLHRVVTKKPRAGDGRGKSTGLYPSESSPSTIVVRRVKSSGSVSRGDRFDFSSAAKSALQSNMTDESDDELAAMDRKQSATTGDDQSKTLSPEDNETHSEKVVSEVKVDEPDSPPVRVEESSVILVDDDELEEHEDVGRGAIISLSRTASVKYVKKGESFSSPASPSVVGASGSVAARSFGA